jgi:predicted alpha/beta superfamily hydrolase
MRKDMKKFWSYWIAVAAAMCLACSGTWASPPLEGQYLKVVVDKIRISSSAEIIKVQNARAIFYFNESKFFLDATELDVGVMTGDFNYADARDQSAKVSLYPWNARANQFAGAFTVQLNYKDDSTGSAVLELDERNGSIQFMGEFTLGKISFNRFRNNGRQHIFEFNVDEVSASDPAFPIARGQKWEANLANSQDIHLKHWQNSTGQPSTTLGTYAMQYKNPFNANLEGVLESGKQPFSISLAFDDVTTGKFTMDVGQGKSKASGSFRFYRYMAFEPATFQGKLGEEKLFASKITGVQYPYRVYLPASYEKSNKKYPLLVVTDGQWHANFADALDTHKKEVIMVALGQGPNDRRAVDYQAPGAQSFIKFLKTEFVPHIESEYRSNGVRSFFGTSLGGTLGAILLADEDPQRLFFKTYVLSDGAFWALTPGMRAAEERAFPIQSSFPVRILLSGTSQGNGPVAERYAAKLKERKHPDIQIQYKKLNSRMHEEMSGATFLEYIDVFE